MNLFGQARRLPEMLATDPCQTCGVNDRRQRLLAARLYLVCDARPDEFLQAALRGGVDLVQLRLKESSDEEILTAAERFKRACEAHGALFILNDRPELAAAADADGVHLGQDDMPVQEARAIVGSERLIGLSTHTPRQITEARHMGRSGARGVDYIGVGPVHATPTKPGPARRGARTRPLRRGQGECSVLRHRRNRHRQRPVGKGRRRAAHCRRAGADGGRRSGACGAGAPCRGRGRGAPWRSVAASAAGARAPRRRAGGARRTAHTRFGSAAAEPLGGP